MTSPAEQWLAEARAKQQATTDQLTTTERLVMQWIEHRRELSTIQSRQAKIERKGTFLPIYQGFLDGALSATATLAEKDAQMFVEVLVWHIDCALFEPALSLARYAIERKLAPPDRYQRQLPVIIADEIADTALHPDATTEQLVLAEYLDLLDDCDIPDIVRAKLYKAHGNALVRAELPGAAVHAYRQALSFDDKCGVKKDIERLERAIKNATKNSPESGGQKPADPA